MRELQLCPALIIHNNSTFSDRDFKGILRVGTGGKRGRMDTIGQFGLGSLVMFHFTEVSAEYTCLSQLKSCLQMAMIVSRDQVLFLDPSKVHLAAFTKRATVRLSLEKMQRLNLIVFRVLYAL
jgi:sacsin